MDHIKANENTLELSLGATTTSQPEADGKDSSDISISETIQPNKNTATHKINMSNNDEDFIFMKDTSMTEETANVSATTTSIEKNLFASISNANQANTINGEQNVKSIDVAAENRMISETNNLVASSSTQITATIAFASSSSSGVSSEIGYKRNTAVKITSGQSRNVEDTNVVNNSIKKNLRRPAAASSQIKISQGNQIDDDDATIYDSDSEEDYIPPKNIQQSEESEQSDREENQSFTKKSKRTLKKPKMLEDYELIADSPETKNTLNVQSPQQPPIQLKNFARKSTAPLSTSNQNILINQQKQHIPSIAKVASTITSNIYQNQNNNNKPVNNLANVIASNSIKQAQSGIKQHFDTLNNCVSVTNSTLTTTINNNTHQQANTQATQANTVKQYRHKIVSCKPFYQSKSTECYPIMKDASTQLNLDDIKLTHTILPLPLPINVPIPMCMYQAPMPIPMIMPIPIPVPIFIPTTKKTYDRIERKIKKLRKKLPSDPYEFELLLYAEKLAREEGIEGFEESSDGESDPEDATLGKRKLKNQYQQQCSIFEKDQSINLLQQSTFNSHVMQTDQNQHVHMVQNNEPQQQEGFFKWVFGLKVFNTWLSNKIERLKQAMPHHDQLTPSNRIPDDLLKLKNDELNLFLVEFIHEVRKPSGEQYAPESIYYLCLGIQYHLQEKGRVENIFLDSSFELFQDALNEIAMRYQIRINTEGIIVSRIEEEILWESKQLGAYSPFVLLNTILYFNTKHFFLDKPESHMQLSFTNVKKHSKRNIGPNGEDYGKSVFLRYYPDFQGMEQVIYEQGENYENPVRCPVELYNFYLSKCPDSVKNRNDVFYLLPERASLPTSPVWFSSQPVGIKMLEKMLNRIKMVKEVNELLLAASPAAAASNLI